MLPMLIECPTITSPSIGCFALTSSTVYIFSTGPTVRVNLYVGVVAVRVIRALQAGAARKAAAPRTAASRSIEESLVRGASMRVRVTVVVLVVAVVVLLPHRLVHHPQHRAAAGREETPDEHGRDSQGDDVEPGRHAQGEGNAGALHLRIPLLRHEAEGVEEEADHEPRRHHRRAEGREQEGGHPEPVVAAIDVEEGEDDEVGEEERDPAAEADPAVPEDGGERHVADRADEAEDGHERADDGAPDVRPRRMLGQEEGLPP